VSETIHLHAHLLERGRRFHRLGRPAEARVQLQRLLDDSDVASDVRAEAHRVFGQLELDAGRFRKARRHFVSAIGLEPLHAESYLLYANAVHSDPDADPRKAVIACRRATRLFPSDPRYWAALGQSCLNAGNETLARKAYRRAARLRLDDLEILDDVVRGLVRLGRSSEARRVLTAARFRMPRNAGVAGLWKQFRFDSARREQRRRRLAINEQPVLLPFTPARNSNAKETVASPVVPRADRTSRPQPHLLRHIGRQSDPRRAN
jgi:Flp pilus assembly protein TadD